MSRQAHRTIGLTLIETTLVVATIALMVGFAAPAVRSLVKSFQSEGGAVSMVNAALSSARAMAVSRQRYVGIRFQKLCTSEDPADPLKGLMDAPQYMIFIMNEEMSNRFDIANGFQAVDGLEPIKLPLTMGFMDLRWVASDVDLDKPFELCNATTFSIVFGPSGKLITHDVRVRNKDGVNRPASSLIPPTPSTDDIFNVADTIIRLDASRPRRGMFIQDDYPRGDSVLELGLGEEASVVKFVIYEQPLLRTAYDKQTAWTGYLSRLAREFYVSPYTGELISSN